MTLSALRTREDQLRKELVAVRAALGEAVAKVHAAARAEQELAQLGGVGGGAYRDTTAERAAQMKAEIAAGSAARETRAGLRRQEAALLEELESTRLDIERAGVRRSLLKVLDEIPNASACPMRWDDMAGDGDSRVCPQCKSVVVDVSMLEPDAAEALLATAPGARFHRRRDGTLLARDCVAVQRKRMLRWGCGFFAAATFASCAAAAMVDFRLGRHPYSIPVTPGGDAPRLDFHDATSIGVEHAFTSMGGDTRDHLELAKRSDGWSYEATCAGWSQTAGHASGVVPASAVDAFLRAVEARSPSAGAKELPCAHTDDYPKFHVTVSTPHDSVSLSVENCSYQWHADGRPLANDSRGFLEPAPESEHAEINAAYGKLLDAIDLTACERASKGPHPL